MLYRSEQFHNRWIHEVLPDGSWKGKPCAIIGGGPSLRGFDWDRLRGIRTIGVNLAFKAFDPTICFSMDTRFLRWIEDGSYGAEVTKRFNETTAYKVWLATYTIKVRPDIFIVRVHKDYRSGLQAFTFRLKEGIGHGDNSGYGALNLACCLGANPIYLLGFDMAHPGGETHWHSGHPVKQRLNTILRWLKNFRVAAPIIEQAGIKVYNLNPDSGLDCFEKKPAEAFL